MTNCKCAYFSFRIDGALESCAIDLFVVFNGICQHYEGESILSNY